MPVDPTVLAGMRRQARSYWPDGHIHIGDSVPHGNGVLPKKLFTFRFTSPSKAMIEAAADLYGGTVAEMTRGMDKWQVVTAADEVPVVLPPRPVTQWLELWDGPYCLRRCDGATIEQKSGRPCLCKADGRLRCTIKTRLSVLLADVPSLGTWLLVSGGLNAAEDLPDRAALIEKAGDYVDAYLMVRKGTGMQDGRPVTFPVPRLRVEGISPRQVMTGTVPERSAMAARTAPALTTGRDPSDYVVRAMAATTPEQVRAIWRQASQAGHLTRSLGTVLNALGAALHDTPGTRPATAAETAQDSAADHPAAAGEQNSPADHPADHPDDHPGDHRLPAPPPPDGQEETASWWRQRILALWQGGTSALYEAFFAKYATTMRHAGIDQLREFAALCQQVHATTASGADVVDADMVETHTPDPQV